jgi:hypothetical protein
VKPCLCCEILYRSELMYTVGPVDANARLCEECVMQCFDGIGYGLAREMISKGKVPSCKVGFSDRRVKEYIKDWQEFEAYKERLSGNI